MPTYQYKAKNGPGRTVEGEIGAESRAAAAAALDAAGLSPVWIGERGPSAARRRLASFRSAGPREVTVFTRQLAGLLRAGVPILRALSTLREQATVADFRGVVEDIETRIRGGGMLSEALQRHPRLFPDLYVNMVRAGEAGGVLDAILLRLADAREHEEDVRRKVQAALAYPLLVLVVGGLTVFALLAFFLPRVVELFEGYQDLPLPTRLLIGLSHFFSSSWHWFVIGAGLLYAVYRRLASGAAGRLALDGLVLRIAPLRGFLLPVEIARFARTLALLIDSGVNVDRGLELAARTLRNSVLRAEIEEVRRGTVQQGAPMSVGLRRAPHIPPFVASMAAVGEESGRIDSALNEAALFLEREVEQKTRLATSLLEPVLILAVGAVVGMIVTAMLLPIFDLGKSMR